MLSFSLGAIVEHLVMPPVIGPVVIIQGSQIGVLNKETGLVIYDTVENWQGSGISGIPISDDEVIDAEFVD